MAEAFDPYYTWLGIPFEEQPPNYYRLLGLPQFEADRARIRTAADEQAGKLHGHGSGEHARLATKLLNEVSAAKACLLNQRRKAAYDLGLRQTLRAKRAEEPKTGRPGGQGATSLEQRWRELVQKQERDAPQPRLPAENEELGFAPLEEEKRQRADWGPPQPPEPEEEADLVPLSDEEPFDLGRELDQDTRAEGDLVPIEDELWPEPIAPETKLQPPQRPKGPPPSPPAPLAASGARGGESGSAAKAAAKSRARAAAQPGAATPPGESAPSRVPRPAPPMPPPAAPPLPPVAPPAPTMRIGERRNVWDSPLILVGGGAILALVILLGALLWAVTRQTGDEALRLANEDYRAEKYGQAIHKYDQYLERFPNHWGASGARVNRGLAQLRQATARGTTDWTAALQTAKEVVGEIGGESEFKTAHGDLAAMLLAIAEASAKQAGEKQDPAAAARAQESLDLIGRYASSFRRSIRATEIEAALALANHDIARGRELTKAVAAIRKAVAGGDPRQAYQIRKTLVKQYPLLADNDELHRVMAEVSRAQQKGVRMVEQPQPAETSPPSGSVAATVVPAPRTAKSSPSGTQGHVAFAVAAGAVYGLDAASGKVLWRQWIGPSANGRSTPFAPTPISSEAGSDALMVVPATNELWRVEAATGRPRWRHGLGERFDAHPVIARNRILVPTLSGRLVMIDMVTGNSPGFVQLPQPLPVAPAVDPTRGLIFQLADHSNLFVLGLDDGGCRTVVPLGHEAGSITAPPLAMGSFLVVAINDRFKDSVLRVLALGEADGGMAVKPGQEIRLAGHVDTPLLAEGRKVLVATDRGLVSVFELSATDPKAPARKVAETPVAGAENLIRFPLMQGGSFWIAGEQLAKYDIQAARNELVPKWATDEKSVFQQPLAAVGQAICTVRRRAGVPGVFVAAVGMDEPNVFWETHLASPLAAAPLVDQGSGQITAVTASGAVFQVATASVKGQFIVDRPTVALPAGQLRGPIRDVMALGDGGLVLTAGPGVREIAVIDARVPPKPARIVRLPEALACTPLAFRGGLLVPTKAGAVFLIDLHNETGKPLAEPFQPPLAARAEVAWQPPVLAGDDEVLLSDGKAKLYRLGLRDQPRPHLAALGEADMPAPLASPIAVVGQMAFAVDARGVLAAFDLPTLKRREIGQPLAGPCPFGPERVGDRVLLTTADDQLLCLDAKGQLTWQVKLPYGPLAGDPLPIGDHYLLAAASGVVWRVEAATGKELGKIDTKEPLAAGPVLVGEQLLVGGHDGCLFIVPQP